MIEHSKPRTSRTTAIVLVLVMLAIVAWGLFFESGTAKIIVNGHELTGPLNGAVGAFGLVVACIAMFCAAILLVFVLAGIGIIFVGCMIVVAMLLIGLASPYMLLLLIPLLIVWAFVAFAFGSEPG